MSFRKLGLALLLMAVAGISNASIVRTYTATNGSGDVTFTDLGSNQLQIDIDNTSDNNNVGPGVYLNSSAITGLVFDILADINAMTVDSFVDGAGVDLSGSYVVGLDVNNNITPGNTMVDLSIKTTDGINGGIYNFDKPGSDLNNVVRDIATIVLNISDPASWALSSIENDRLRMQRVGPDGAGSLKIDGAPAVVPVPAAVWLFGSGLLGLVGIARRKRS